MGTYRFNPHISDSRCVECLFRAQALRDKVDYLKHQGCDVEINVGKMAFAQWLVYMPGMNPTTMCDWCREFPRVHVGRVNTSKYLDICASLGVESCDGTGWFKGRTAQLIELGTFLAKQVGHSALEVEWIAHHTRHKNHQQLAMPMEEAS